MKSYIKKLFILFFLTVLAFSLASCDKIDEIFAKGNEEYNELNTDNILNVSVLYDQAKDLGYDGSFDDFREKVKGKDGNNGKNGKNGKDAVTISSSIVNEDGHLIFILSNGKTIDAGKLSVPSTGLATGVYKVTFDLGDGDTFEIYSKNYKIEMPKNEPMQDGYTFGGWSYIESASNDYEPWKFVAYAVTKDMTLYATWISNDVPEELPEDGPAVDDPDHEEKIEWWEDITYDETDLIFMMTNCSNREELSSGCERYLAGEGGDVGTENIDILVRNRNDNAYDLTNVNVTYKYYDDNAELFGFSRMYDVIEREVFAADSSTPDIYCNWITDLLICSLKGCFANVYSTHYGYGTYAGENYFTLANNGYMQELMESLTLSESKMYVIASDYFIDIIRSLFVIPVNVTLFNEIAVKMYPEVSNPTFDTFLEEVKPCDCTNENAVTRCTEHCAEVGWTYDRLLEFSETIYMTNETGTNENINSRLGFALGANGQPAAGLIYSSSVNIIKKAWNDDEGAYNYSYPSNNTDLYDLFDKISNMIDINGVYYVTSADANSLNFEGPKTPLLAIRNQFTCDKLLFGGIVMLGSLEYQSYQEMKTSTRGGFGIVPVPVFRAGDDYKTQPHVVARAGAINRNTTKFVQCSAFIQYQSSHSKAIVEDYYEYTLVTNAATGETVNVGNLDMIRYMRQNMGSSMDKFFEDAIGFMYADVDDDFYRNRYHILLADNGYQFSGIRTKYEELQPVKAAALANLEYDYKKLPE